MTTTERNTTRRRRGGRRSSKRAAERAAARRALARDVAGVLMLTVGALAGLGAYAGAAGPVGDGLAAAGWRLFGLFGYAVPVVLLVFGGAVLAERAPARRRPAGGIGLVGVGLLGLWHLVAGAPRLDAAAAELQAAGGWVGALVAGPLVALAAPAGAVVLLAVVTVAGLLVATATTPRQVADWVAETAAEAKSSWQRGRERRRERRRQQAAEADTVPLAKDAERGADDSDAVAAAAPDPLSEPEEEPATPASDAAEADAEPEVADTALLPVGVDVGRNATAAAATDDDYEIPAVELLATGRVAPGNKRALDQMTRALEHTLRQFNVDATVDKVRRGATVTRLELKLADGVRVNAVTKLTDDLAYALATPEIRIVAPIPGKSAIGVEVPNRERDLITLGDLLRSEQAGADPHPLAVGLGVDIGGNYVMANLTRMPHLLIAGATGSGKSVLMNSIVTSVLMRATPAQARMVLIDPKRVELNHYEGVPHLITPVITDPKRATEALKWVVDEMERRYTDLSEQGFRNIDAWNAAVRRGDLNTPREGTRLAADRAAATARGDEWAPPELDYVMVVIDELADLMMIAARDVESAIVRIAQMARAVGIHLIVATQRPSVDVVTGLIKANIPSRIALSMATGHDSKTILDSYGAEKLVGDGDMLFLPANASKPHRLQGCFLDEEEIERVVGACTDQATPDYRSGVISEGEDAIMADAMGEDAADADLTRAAMDLVVRSGLGSTSMLQRKLKVGFARAGRLMDELEELGVVGPSEGPKARQVLMSVEELEHRTPQAGGPDGA